VLGADPPRNQREIPLEIRWKSTADPSENKQTNQLRIPKPPQSSGTNLNLRNNWRRRVIELTIPSQMHSSKFNLGAWLCLNLGCKVVGLPRRWGADPIRNQREISAKSTADPPEINK
jgi:hypothetical protein